MFVWNGIQLHFYGLRYMRDGFFVFLYHLNYVMNESEVENLESVTAGLEK